MLVACAAGCQNYIDRHAVTGELKFFLNDRELTEASLTFSPPVEPLLLTMSLVEKQGQVRGRPIQPVDRWWMTAYIEPEGDDPARPKLYGGPMYMYGPVRTIPNTNPVHKHGWYANLADDAPYPSFDMGQPMITPTEGVRIFAGHVPVPPVPGRYTLVVAGRPCAPLPDEKLTWAGNTHLLELPVVVE